MRSTFRAAALCAAIAAAAASAPVRAQTAPQGTRPAAARFEAMREAHERQRAQDLKTVLRLRPDQEPALAAFLQRQAPPPGGPPERDGPPDRALTTPQRLDDMARRDAEHARAREAHTERLRAFYAALDPQQRQVFDALQRMRSGGHGHGGPGGHEASPREGWGHRGFGGPPPMG